MEQLHTCSCKHLFYYVCIFSTHAHFSSSHYINQNLASFHSLFVLSFSKDKVLVKYNLLFLHIAGPYNPVTEGNPLLLVDLHNIEWSFEEDYLTLLVDPILHLYSTQLLYIIYPTLLHQSSWKLWRKVVLHNMVVLSPVYFVYMRTSWMLILPH